jgi:hypothetical protein
VQRELRALAGHAGEQQQGGDRDGRVGVHGERGQDVGDPEAARVYAQDHDAEQEADVADPGHDEGLHRGGGRLRQRAVVADQQVRADAHDLPADQQQDEVAGDHDQQHGGGEEAHLGGVRRVAVVVVQVGDRVDLHGERDHADREGDQDGRPVDPYAERDRQVADPHPLDRRLERLVVAQGEQDGDEQRAGRAPDAEARGERPGAQRQQEPGEGRHQRYGGQQRPERIQTHLAASRSSSSLAGAASSATSSTATLARSR